MGMLVGICLIGNSKGILANKTANQETLQNVQKSKFIFDESDKFQLTEMDLICLEPEALALARNEIYARHG